MYLLHEKSENIGQNFKVHVSRGHYLGVTCSLQWHNKTRERKGSNSNYIAFLHDPIKKVFAISSEQLMLKNNVETNSNIIYLIGRISRYITCT